MRKEIDYACVCVFAQVERGWSALLLEPLIYPPKSVCCRPRSLVSAVTCLFQQGKLRHRLDHLSLFSRDTLVCSLHTEYKCSCLKKKLHGNFVSDWTFTTYSPKLCSPPHSPQCIFVCELHLKVQIFKGKLGFYAHCRHTQIHKADITCTPKYNLYLF